MELASPLPTGSEPAVSTTPSAPPDANAGNWISNEGLLRDEGVLFGRMCALGASENPTLLIENKLAAIRDFFAKKVGAEEATVAFLNAEESRMERRLERLHEERDSIRRLFAAPERPDFNALQPGSEVQVARFTLGFLFSLAGSALSVLIVYTLLDGGPLGDALLPSLGICLLALFSVFQPVSILLAGDAAVRSHPDSAERWKLYLSDVLVPLGAAAFVVAWSPRLQNWQQILSTFVLLASVFAVNGRIVLGTATRLTVALRLARADSYRRKNAAGEQRAETQRVEGVEAEIAVLDEALATLRNRRAECLSQIAVLKNETEERVHLFLSEFDLALGLGRSLNRPFAEHDAVAAATPSF